MKIDGSTLFSASIGQTCHEESSHATAYANFVKARTRVHEETALRSTWNRIGRSGATGASRAGEMQERTSCVAHSHLTRCDTARGSRGTGGPRANANLLDRPFSTDETERPTELPLESRYTIPVLVSPAPPQPLAAIPLPSVDLSTCIPIYPWTYPRSGSTRLGSCRVRHLSVALFTYVSTLFSSSWSRKYLYCTFRNAIRGVKADVEETTNREILK